MKAQPSSTIPVAFFGATGMIGSLVTLELLERGFKLTLFGRSPTKMRKSFGPAVSIYQTDPPPADTQLTALAGHESLVVCTGMICQICFFKCESMNRDSAVAAAAFVTRGNKAKLLGLIACQSKVTKKS